MSRYYQPEIETMPREELHRLQSEKLVKQVRHVYDNVPYYRDLMDKAGVKPEDRAPVPAAMAVAERTGLPAVAIQLPDGQIATMTSAKATYTCAC